MAFKIIMKTFCTRPSMKQKNECNEIQLANKTIIIVKDNIIKMKYLTICSYTGRYKLSNLLLSCF